VGGKPGGKPGNKAGTAPVPKGAAAAKKVLAAVHEEVQDAIDKHDKGESIKEPLARSARKLAAASIAAEMADAGVRTLDDDGLSIVIPGVIPTGDHWLDHALGRGGWPLTRASLVGGDEGCGKTTLALKGIANVQKMGGLGYIADAEYKLDRDYAKWLGVDLSSLLIAQPPHAEAAWNGIREYLGKMRAARELDATDVWPSLIVCDSLTAFVPKAEVEGDVGDVTIGLQARIFGQSLRIIVGELSHERAHLMMITQLRQKIGQTHGDDDVTAGGKSPRFYATQIVKLEPGASLREGDQKVGQATRVTISKNQVAAPFQKCVINHYYKEGWDVNFGIHEMLKASGMGKLAGSWVTIDVGGREVKYQGADGYGKLAASDQEAVIRAIRDRYGWDDADLYIG
jgi:recombination protein RecA